MHLLARRPTSGWTRVGATLFLSLFAAQAGVIAAAPVLALLADDLGVSTAVAGQLRTVAGISAALTALAAAPVSRVLSLRRQLLAGAVLLGLGSLASACAPSFVVLLAAQVPLGVGVAGLTTAGTLAAAEWVPEEHRMRTLSWAVVGQPAAWIVGMPLVGLVGAGSWRLGWIALPLAASLVAAVAVLGSRAERETREPQDPVPLRVALESDRLRRWLVSELLANAAWVGTLVYAGAMLVDEHHASSGSAGVLLASAAVGYIAGTMGMRRAAALALTSPSRFSPLALPCATQRSGGSDPMS